jgi:hypothetical protein
MLVWFLNAVRANGELPSREIAIHAAAPRIA